MSGRMTVFSGERIFAVSAMKRTPQKAITSASVAGGLARQIEAVADEVREVLDLRLLIIMREDDRVALALQPLDLGEQVEPRQARWSEPSFLSPGRATRAPPPRSPHYMGSRGRDRKDRRVPSVGKRATTFTSLNPAARSGIAKLRSTAARADCARELHRHRPRSPACAGRRRPARGSLIELLGWRWSARTERLRRHIP